MLDIVVATMLQNKNQTNFKNKINILKDKGAVVKTLVKKENAINYIKNLKENPVIKVKNDNKDKEIVETIMIGILLTCIAVVFTPSHCKC